MMTRFTRALCLLALLGGLHAACVEAGSVTSSQRGFIIVGSVTNSQSSETHTFYSGASTGLSSAAADFVPIPIGMTCRNLRCSVTTAPGAGTSWACTLMTGAAGSPSATSLTCSIANTDVACADTTNTATLTAGNVGLWRFTPTGAVAATVGLSASAECYY